MASNGRKTTSKQISHNSQPAPATGNVIAADCLGLAIYENALDLRHEH
jgi:hypothetical protein